MISKERRKLSWVFLANERVFPGSVLFLVNDCGVASSQPAEAGIRGWNEEGGRDRKRGKE